MFGKYEILSVLGKSSSTVFLTRHQQLGFYRVIKRIYKSKHHSAQCIQEANFLKHLNHPGIPKVYDVEEDDSFYYVIEEYIEGDSLEAVLLQSSDFTPMFLCKIMIDVCDILGYLHQCEPHPFIYGDLKPEHIILNENQVYLIDFGTLKRMGAQGEQKQNFGTTFFAPQIQVEGGVPCAYFDIYAIGRTFLYLEEKLQLALPVKLKEVMLKATASQASESYSCILALKEEIYEVYRNSIQKKSRGYRSHLKASIAVIGSECHIGCTHLSLSSMAYFQENGIDVVYQEKKAGQTIRSIGKENSKWKQKGLLLASTKGKLLPYYGDGIKKASQTSALLGKVVIKDFGCLDWNNDSQNGESIKEQLEQADIVLLVLGGKEWERENGRRAFYKIKNCKNLVLVCNFEEISGAKIYAKEFNRKVYVFPLDQHLFCKSKKKTMFFNQIYEEGKNKWSPLG